MALNEKKGLAIAGIGSVLVVVTTILANTSEIWKNTKNPEDTNKPTEAIIIEEETESENDEKTVETVIVKEVETVVIKEVETIFIKETEAETETQLTENMLPTPEEFLESGYNKYQIELYLNEHGKSFNMNGRTYYSGIKLGHGDYSNRGIAFNVEKMNTIFFTIGHVDDEDTSASELEIYLDDVLYDTVNLSFNMPLNEYTLDVSDTSNVYFDVKASCGVYAIADISFE